MHRCRSLLLVVAVSVALAACSSGSSKGSSTTTTTARTSSTSTVDREDVALAEAGLITQADVPGFTANPATTKAELDEIDALAKTLPACKTFMAAKQDGDVQRRSPQWAMEQTTADSSTDVYADVDAITAQLELYRDPTIVDCYRALYTEVIKKGVPKNATVKVDVSPIAVEVVGDAQFGFRISVQVDSVGRTQTQIADAIGVQVGRAGLSLNVSGTVPEMAKLESDLLPALVKGLEDAQA